MIANAGISGTIDISYQTRGRGAEFPVISVMYGEDEVLTLGNLYVNEHVTCDFKSSSPVTVSLL